MFALQPDGDNTSGSGPSQLNKNIKFFGKLGLYFFAVRLAFVYFGDNSKEIDAAPTDSSISTVSASSAN